MEISIFIAAAFPIVYLAFVSRWHGGGFFKAPKIVKAFCWAIVFAMATAIVTQSFWVSLAVLVLCMLGKNTGHGGFMDLGRWDKPRDDEKLEFLIKWAKPKMSEQTYDAIGLAIVGLAAVGGAALAIGAYNPLAGLFIALGGAAKGYAYMIGYLIFSTFEDYIDPEVDDLDEPTEYGELLTGAFAGAGLVLGLLII